MNRIFPVVALLIGNLLCTAQAQRLDNSAPQPNAGGGLDYIVAIVDDGVILASEVTQMRNDAINNLQNQGTPIPPRAELDKQILDQLIITRIQLQRAERNGIKVDDEQVNTAINAIAERNQMSLTEFAAAIEGQGMNFRAFRNRIQDDIAVQQLQRRELERRINISEREIDDFIASMTIRGDDLREYRLRHILVSVPEGASPSQRSIARKEADGLLTQLKAGADFGELAAANSDAQNALQGGEIGWRKTPEIPALFADSVARLKVGQFSKIIGAPSGFHIVSIMERRDNDPFKVIESDVRHILIQTTEVKTDAEARARLRDIRKKLRAGQGDFASFAKQYSDDPGSAINGGDLGWAPPGQFVPEFEEALDGLEVNELSVPFRSRFGWHLIELKARRERDGTDSARRTQARRILGQRKSEEELELWLRRLRDEAYVEMLDSQ